MTNESLSTETPGRKSRHSLPPATPRPRSFIAGEVMAEKLANGTIAASAVYDHLGNLPRRTPRGTRASPIRGADTVKALAQALIRAVRTGWGTREGSAVDLCERLHAAGHLQHLPSARTAGMAWATMARLSPLIVELRRGRYQVLAGRPASLPAPILKVLLVEALGDSYADRAVGEVEDLQAASDGSACNADPSSLPAVAAGYKERARGGSSFDPVTGEVLEDSSGEPWCFELDEPGAVACSPAPPVRAEQVGSAGAEEARPSDGGEPVGVASGALTRSGYLARVTHHRRIAQAAGLLLAHCPDFGIRGTASDVARVLAAHEHDRKLRARDRSALATALLSILRRGLVIERDGRWYLPSFAVHPALVMLDIAERPGQRRPSLALANALLRRGIDPEGLSNDEAIAVNRRLHSRRQADKATVRQVAAIERQRQRAGLPADLRATGRLDFASARARIEVGMRRHMDSELMRDYEGDHG